MLGIFLEHRERWRLLLTVAIDGWWQSFGPLETGPFSARVRLRKVFGRTLELSEVTVLVPIGLSQFSGKWPSVHVQLDIL